MLVKDDRGNMLLDFIVCDEATADEGYAPITHCLLAVKLGDDYLMGWNNWREDWEIFGGCREEGETLRACIVRECREELGLDEEPFTFLGLMHYDMAPGYFNPQRHNEYGALYGVTLSEEYLERIETRREDRDEIQTVSLLSSIRENEKIAPIDRKLLDYWR